MSLTAFIITTTLLFVCPTSRAFPIVVFPATLGRSRRVVVPTPTATRVQLNTTKRRRSEDASPPLPPTTTMKTSLHVSTGAAGFVTPSSDGVEGDKTPSSSPSLFVNSQTGINSIAGSEEMGRVKGYLTKMAMVIYIVSICLALPIVLLPPTLLEKTRVINRIQRERQSLRMGQFAAQWLLRLIPFCKVNIITPPNWHEDRDPEEPSIWVCNHTSMLDVFILLAMDKKLRGNKRRPIKVVYWKQLEANPISKLFFNRCGFIPVDMVANKPGEPNEYHRSTFKSLLKLTKQAFVEGFDIGVLPEGQLNPTPEQGLLPVFSGAFTLSKMSNRPIKMIALSGLHKLWHPNESIGMMKVTGRKVSARCYPHGRKYESCEEFLKTFSTVVGYFGAWGEDLPKEELNQWLDGTQWKSLRQLVA